MINVIFGNIESAPEPSSNRARNNNQKQKLNPEHKHSYLDHIVD